jgi:hypothetical protein
MKRVLLIAAAMSLVMAASAPTASAGLITVGDPFITNSWGQRWNESGVGLFDKMEFFIVSGESRFEDPGIANFSSGGWTGAVVNPSYALASGAALTSMDFDSRFTGNTSPITFYFLAWQDVTLLEFVRVTWNGGWSYASLNTNSSGQYDFDRSPAVPDGGATLVLLGGALMGLGALRRKFRL